MAPSESRSARTFSVDAIENTIGVPEGEPAAGTSTDGFRLVALPGLTGTLQFFRVPIVADASDEPACTLLVVNAAHPPLADEQVERVRATLTSSQGDAIPCFVDAFRTGWARARAARGVDREATAVAVAVVQYGASWDETEPIVVDVDGIEFAVSVSFGEGKLRARVALID